MKNDLSAWEIKFESFISNMGSSDAAHELGHIKRVVNWAKKIAIGEGADLNVVIPAAWLHDCVTVAKDSPDRSKASFFSAKRAQEFLQELEYPKEFHDGIFHAIHAHSFSAKITPETIEAKVVQDADRLEAIGAIGIARCLMLGGEMGRVFCNDLDPFCNDRIPDDSKYALDHFYAKLLTISDTMQTQAGRVEAKKRHEFLLSYLSQLSSEIL